MNTPRIIGILTVWLALMAGPALAQHGEAREAGPQAKVDPRLRMRSRAAELGTKSGQDAVGLQRTFVHFAQRPSADQVRRLEALGATVYEESWIPPLANHPTGFLIVDLPTSRVLDAAAEASVARITSAEEGRGPATDRATADIGCVIQWQGGHEGSGVRLAILDSGLDLGHPDIPPPLAYKDYSNWPDLDNSVANTVTGHGTHITGIALGRGTQSQGVYRGAAPAAQLIFLKIGDDITATASLSATVAAIKDAVDIYRAQVLCISYGGWGSYHDGSEEDEQAVDYAVGKGTTVLAAAGNKADDDMHCSGVVAAHDSASVVVDASSVALFNLVWHDGSQRTDLELLYYDDRGNRVDSDPWPQTESDRGTESQWSSATCDPGRQVEMLRVVNHSDAPQTFHLYATRSYPAAFEAADPQYTIDSPATAEGAIAVGAYVTRERFQNYHFDTWYTFGESYYEIASFSSRGPTVDGRPKPDLVAPGSAIISARDRDVYVLRGIYDANVIDNDGDPNTVGYDYYVLEGTSTAAPLAAGAAAVLLGKNPGLGPEQIREALTGAARSDGYTGDVPNYAWGAGRLNLPYSKVLGAGWNTLAFPSVSPTTPAQVLGDLIRPFHTRPDNSNIYALHEPSGRYVVPEVLRTGVGYYVYSWVRGVSVTAPYADMLAQPDTTIALSHTPSSGYPGWHLLGNPYWVSVDWDDALAQPGTENVDGTYYVYSSQTGWQFYNVLTGGGGRGSAIEPQTGFVVHASAAPAALTLANPVIGAGAKAVVRGEHPNGWRMQLSATGQSGPGDLYNYAGVHAEASDAYDPRDVHEWPPMDSDAVVLCFPHPEWQGGRTGDYAQDMRGPTGQGSETWRFEVRCSAGEQQVQLSWADVGEVPEAYALTLRDLDGGVGLDPRQTTSYAFRSEADSAGVGVRHFALEARATAAAADAAPTAYALKPNFPNPFNAETVVEYALPQDGFVRIVVYNALGQAVRRLVASHRKAGVYRATWDGRNDGGEDVASGMYICRMSSGVFDACRRMILLR